MAQRQRPRDQPDGSPTTSGNVNLTPETRLPAAGQPTGTNYGGRISWDGAFSIANVPPGRYMLRARGNDAEWPQFASLAIDRRRRRISPTSP